jgi:beta-phosphoglucomutase-like phosphatase (HAD superfamily)
VGCPSYSPHSLVEVLCRRGIEIPQALYEERYLGLGTDRDAFRRVAEDFSRPDLLPEIDRIVAEKAKRMRPLLDSAPLCAGARELVREAEPIGPLAVVSGAHRHENGAPA